MFENNINENFDNEINNKNHDIFMLKEKISDFQKTIESLKECLTKKDNSIKIEKICELYSSRNY